MQPLQDNLESQTYETFERDTNKYLAYEEAVLAALQDRVPPQEAATRTTVPPVSANTPEEHSRHGSRDADIPKELLHFCYNGGGRARCCSWKRWIEHCVLMGSHG